MAPDPGPLWNHRGGQQRLGCSSLEFLTDLAAAFGPKRVFSSVEWVMKLISKKKNLSVLSCLSGAAAANFSLVLLAPAAWRSAQQVSFERFSSLWWLLKRCRESQPSSKMVLHRFSLACYALIVLRRLLCSLHVPAVTGLPSLQSLSAADFSTAFECLQSLRHVLSSLSTTRCLCALALASCRP